MASVRNLMDPEYARRRSAGGFFDLVSSIDLSEVAMLCWADPFRPDDVTPSHVREAAIASLRGDGAHYTLPIGARELRAEIAAKVARVNGLDVDPDRNITVAGGSEIGLLFGVRPFLEPGAANEVLVPAPSYVTNFDAAPLAGGVSVPVPTYAEDGYELRIDEFEHRLTSKTKAVILTNPNNPTTTVYRRDTLEALAAFIQANDLVLIVDQCFEDTVFDGTVMTQIAALPGMFERTILVASLSKGMALCGYRIGYIVACDEITDVLHACAMPYIGAPNTAAQAAALAALRRPEFMDGYRQEHMARAAAVCDILDGVPNLPYLRPQSGFFVWIDVSRYGGAHAVARYLAQEAAVVPSEGDQFGSADHIRLVYATFRDRDRCLMAVQRLADALARHPANRSLA